jgi:hypothetical protein
MGSKQIIRCLVSFLIRKNTSKHKILTLECCCPGLESWCGCWLKTPDQELRVKASTRFTEKTARHLMVKEPSQRMAPVQGMIQGTNWLRFNYSSLSVIGWHWDSFSWNSATHPAPLIEVDTSGRSGQLVLALGATSHIVQLHLVMLVRGLLFLRSLLFPTPL